MSNPKEVEMFVAGLVLDSGTNAPIVILKEPNEELCMPIWIGLAEATAIASALKKVDLARPMTHDLLYTIIEELGGEVLRIVITGLRDNTFLANLEVRTGDQISIIDCRPSDAIALALRAEASIWVDEEVLAKAQVMSVAAVEGEEGVEGGEDGEKNFANIEKDKWAQILAEMDPDDFKYKM